MGPVAGRLGPDWYGDAAKSFFFPLFDGRVLPPQSSNFGLFNDPALDADHRQRPWRRTSTSQAAHLWHQADVEVMSQAAIFPITDPNRAQIHGSQVHNCIYMARHPELRPDQRLADELSRGRFARLSRQIGPAGSPPGRSVLVALH